MASTNRLARCVSINAAHASRPGKMSTSNGAPSTFNESSNDPLSGGISDALFEDLTELEDPLFGNISDEFFEDLSAYPAQSVVSDTDMSEEDFFGSVPDALFESITDVEHSMAPKASLLTLPPEIRNMIYDLVYVSPSYIGTHRMVTDSFFHEAAQWRNLGFVTSCRQIYCESANIFYAKNGFEFYYIGPLLQFMEGIGFQRRRLLTKLRFNYLSGSPFIALRYLRSCESLRELSISIRVCQLGSPNSGWLYPVKNIRTSVLTDCSELSFGEARGFGAASDAEAGNLSQAAPKAISTLQQALIKVKEENPLRPFG